MQSNQEGEIALHGQHNQNIEAKAGLKYMEVIKIGRNHVASSRLLLAITMIIAILNATEVEAQKTSPKKDVPKKSLPKEISDNDILEGEYYFIEGQKYFMLESYEKAYGYFLQAHAKNPANGAINFRLAEVLVMNGEYSKALPYALSAIKADPLNKYYYLTAANIYTSISNFDEAVKMYETMLSKISGTETYLFELAAIYMYQRNLDKALATYERAKKYYGPMEQITVQKQKIYLSQNKLSEAIREGDELIEAYPGINELLISQAEILIANDKLEEAKKYLNKVLADEPGNAQASIFLSEIYRKSGDTQRAIEMLQAAFADPSLNVEAKVQMLAGYIAQLPNPDLEPLLVKLSELLIVAHPDEINTYAIAGDLLYQLGEEGKALDMYKKVLAQDQSNFGLWQNVINIELQLGKYDSAAISSERALELFPNQAIFYYFGGTAYLINKKYSDAIGLLEQGLKYTNGIPDLQTSFYAQLGDAYNGVGNNAKSDAAYKKALEVQPDNDHVLNNFSYFLSLRKEQLPIALEMSTKLVERNPDNSTYLDTHAWVLYMMGKYKEAHKYLEKAALDKEASGTIVEHYGDVLYKLGDKDKALIQWKRAAEIGGGSDKLDKKIADKKLYE